MDDEKKAIIANALVGKGVQLPCPRCNAVNFEVVGQTSLQLNDNFHNITLGGPSVPTAIIACSNCGFITLHALGVLNLIPIPEKEEKFK